MPSREERKLAPIHDEVITLRDDDDIFESRFVPLGGTERANGLHQHHSDNSGRSSRSSRHFYNMNRHRYLATLWCSFFCMFFLWKLPFSLDIHDASSTRTMTRRHTTTTTDTAVSLAPGELPGYTGWARLEYTLAGYFEIQQGQDENTVALVGKEWNVTVACLACGASSANTRTTAHFYARAYGPAVLAGRVTRQQQHNHVYTISFLPMDAGLYTVEVVLVSSGAPSWDDFPVVGQEPWYEGFLLPSFPLQVQVVHEQEENVMYVKNTTCTLSDLLSGSIDSDFYKARWVVVDKLSHWHHLVPNNASRTVNLSEYRSGRQSLGIFMEYRYKDCELYSYQDASKRLTNALNAHDENKIHFIFVGDSVMRMQHALFQQTFSTVKTTYICISAGLVPMMSMVTTRLQELAHQFPNERRILLFNSGLHDVSQLCSRVFVQERRAYISQPDSNFSCTAQYRQSLSQLVRFIDAYPADLKVFQSTTAGWLRYGNYDIEWLTNETQSLALSSNMVEYFNQIAFQVMANVASISIMDAYWMTLARPDNRQVGPVSNRGKHLVHPGKEVLKAMVNKWIHVLLHYFLRKPS